MAESPVKLIFKALFLCSGLSGFQKEGFSRKRRAFEENRAYL